MEGKVPEISSTSAVALVAGQEKEYMNILIPACFGGVLSDFLGLRFATHIRCTLGINQTANILLYSFTGVQDYFSNECFNILKTNGVNLIDYNIQSIINEYKYEYEDILNRLNIHWSI